MKSKTWIPMLAVIVLAGVLLGCGSQPAAEAEEPGSAPASAPVFPPPVTPTPAAPPTPEIVYLEVTPVPRPTPTPQIIYVQVTPVPTPTPPATATATPAPTPTPAPAPTATPTPLPTATPPPTPTAAPTVTPAPTPTPGPTPRFRTAPRPADAGYPGFRFVSGPEVSGHTISFKAVVAGEEELAPTQLQVWQSLRDDLDQVCSTARPIAFVGQGQGAGFTRYQWTFCSSATAKPQIHTDAVPWLTAETWQTLRRSSNPLVYEWTVTVNLDHRRVRELMYEHAAGFVLVGFAGETLLTRRWAE